MLDRMPVIPTPDSRFLPCAECAKLLREQLKREFPGVKFSVRSEHYAGGASITVSWTDGPTYRTVDAIARLFQSARFDGMIDMADYMQHWLLPDGSVQVASAYGTERSRGTLAAIATDAPHPKAVMVHLGSNYVHCQRKFSAEFLRRAAAWVGAFYDVAPPEVREERGHAWIVQDSSPVVDPHDNYNRTAAEKALSLLRRTDARTGEVDER